MGNLIYVRAIWKSVFPKTEEINDVFSEIEKKDIMDNICDTLRT